MSKSLLPVGAYTLVVEPGIPVLAMETEGTIRITLAAIDPENIKGDKPSTLRILKKVYDDEDEDGLEYPIGEDEDSESDEEEEKPKKKSNKKASKNSKKDDESEEDDDEEDFEISRTVVCTLSPKIAYQQNLDLVINATEDIIFEVTGSYPINLTGNYVLHPFDESSSDEDDSDFESGSDEDEGDYDLSPDEDELDFTAGGRIEEIEDEEEEEEEEEPKPKKVESKKQNKKRAAEPEPTESEPKNKKKQKAEKVEKVEKKTEKKPADKKVAFSKELEQGPTGSTATPAKKTPTIKKLAGGVTIEDRTVGSGPTAQPGSRVSVRYIGKLLNGKMFDSNTKGKPFTFKLGVGEVIKGWDVGVAGMAVKGERRIVVPASSAYGKQSLPGIPANSTLTFDVKLVGIK